MRDDQTMTAKEMFKELGWNRNICNENHIVYTKATPFGCWEIEFNQITKYINFTIINGIDRKLLKAIDKQIEELGWIDE